MVTIKRSLRCKNAGAAPFPLCVLCFNYISHVLLVLNCSVNSLIYCGLSSRFRNQTMVYISWLGKKLGLTKTFTPRSANVATGRTQVGMLKGSFSVNGVRPSNGMTTLGNGGAHDDSPLIDMRNRLTQTTQV